MSLPDPLLEPEPSTWPSLLRDPSARASRVREQLGLPTDRRIVMAGHQLDLWHPGILAKLVAAHAFAKSNDAGVAWLWVDQDGTDPTTLRVPTRDGDAIGVREWNLAPGVLVPPGTPPCARPPIEPASFEGTPHPATRDGATEAIHRALAAHVREQSLARQFAAATLDLLDGLVARPLGLFESSLHDTDLFKELVASMREDPRTVAEAYNGACEAFADAGIRPLAIREKAIELPLWRVRDSEPRMPVYSTQLDEIPPEQLGPRALLMTAIVRLAGCDLFIHGTGGASYDRITARWIRDWLGEDLAPKVVVSATRTLEVSSEALPTEDEIAGALAKAHSAKHDPAIVGDHETAARKSELLAKIERAKQAGEKPSQLFREMQDLLSAYRERSADAIRALEARADELESKKDLAAIAHDRTWAFPLYPVEVLEGLRDDIARAFDGSAR